MTWIHFLHHWPFVRGIHQSGPLMRHSDIFFAAIPNKLLNSQIASDLRCHVTSQWWAYLCVMKWGRQKAAGVCSASVAAVPSVTAAISSNTSRARIMAASWRPRLSSSLCSKAPEGKETGKLTHWPQGDLNGISIILVIGGWVMSS